MLRTETVERGLFELLKTLMQDEHLKNFNLVGAELRSLCIWVIEKVSTFSC